MPWLLRWAVPSNLLSRLRQLDFDLASSQLAQLAAYRDALAEAAQHFNLTAVRSPQLIEQRHIVESLAFLRALESRGVAKPDAKVIDLGTGAGLPGLPIKIARPGLDVSLLDSHAKSCAFLRQVIADLGLTGVSVLQGRAEDIAAQPEQRESYTLVLSRAVAPLPVLLEYALPFLQSGGYLATTKGSASKREVEAAAGALRELGGEVIETSPFQPPDGASQTLVIACKTAPTPARYPRRPGIAAKRPIK